MLCALDVGWISSNFLAPSVASNLCAPYPPLLYTVSSACASPISCVWCSLLGTINQSLLQAIASTSSVQTIITSLLVFAYITFYIYSTIYSQRCTNLPRSIHRLLYRLCFVYVYKYESGHFDAPHRAASLVAFDCAV